MASAEAKLTLIKADSNIKAAFEDLLLDDKLSIHIKLI